MQQNNPDNGTFNALPFYISITILLGFLGTSASLSIFRVGDVSFAWGSAALFLSHIGFYWFNIKAVKSLRWWIFYYAIQTALIVTMAVLLYGKYEIGLSILGSAIICIIGEALGWWGNSRISLLLALFYFFLAIILLFILVDRDSLFLAIGSLLINGGFIVLFMVVLNQQLIERQKAVDLAETLESANAKLAASAARIESLTLQNERQRMARELHDTLAQGVAGLVLQLEAVKTHLKVGRAERAAAIVEQSLASARSTLSDSRAAIDDLRTASTADLSEAVHERVERFTQATGIPCELEISFGKYQPVLQVQEHTLRVLSEALANIARHAQATKIFVKLFDQNDQLELRVEDNGKGFDVESETNAGHYGLLGMRERARLLHGKLIVESKINSGTNICFAVPSLQGEEKR